MKRCLYCKEKIEGKGYSHKIGDFCHEEHYDKYYIGLSNEELVQAINHICVCSHEEE